MTIKKILIFTIGFVAGWLAKWVRDMIVFLSDTAVFDAWLEQYQKSIKLDIDDTQPVNVKNEGPVYDWKAKRVK